MMTLLNDDITLKICIIQYVSYNIDLFNFLSVFFLRIRELAFRILRRNHDKVFAF